MLPIAQSASFPLQCAPVYTGNGTVKSWHAIGIFSIDFVTPTL